MKTRILIGIALVVVVGSLMWADARLVEESWRTAANGGPAPGLLARPWGFLLLAFAALGLCLTEVAGILRKCGMAPDMTALWLSAIILLGSPVLAGPLVAGQGTGLLPAATTIAAGIGLLLVVSATRGLFRKDVETFAGRLAGTLLAGTYVLIPGSMLICLRMLAANDLPHLGLLVIIWLVASVRLGADTCAYFTGRALGKRKLIPHISPGKTVAGFVGGVVGAGALGTGAWALLPGMQEAIPAAVAIPASFLIGLLAPVGDLTASALKRSAGVKDSGQLLPGFGGSLDIIDGFLICGPAVFLAVIVWYGLA